MKAATKYPAVVLLTPRGRQDRKAAVEHDVGHGRPRFAVAFDLGNVVPAIAVDMAEIHAPPVGRGHIGNGKAFVPHRLFQKGERISAMR